MSTANRLIRKQKQRATPKYANPWSFRNPSAIERVAGLDGREVDVVAFKRGGQHAQTERMKDSEVSSAGAAIQRTRLRELRRRRAKLLAQYRLSRLFSEEDMELVEAILRGDTQNSWAWGRDVSRQAVGDRLTRIENRARRGGLNWRAIAYARAFGRATRRTK
jgi:hypothetical protein